MKRNQIRLGLSLCVVTAGLGVGAASGCSSPGEAPESTATVQQALLPCDPAAPFNPPVASFTGTTLVDGITFSQDGLKAYLSGKIGATNLDIFVATRPTTNDPFGAPAKLGDGLVSTNVSERAPALSGDGTRLYFARYVSTGTRANLFCATLNTSGEPTAVTSLGSAFNGSLHDQDPFFHAGTNKLYFAKEPEDGQRDLYVSDFTDPNNPTTPAALDVSPYDDYRPVLSPDGLSLYFSSSRVGIGDDTGGDLWVVKRNSVNDSFSWSSGQVTNLYTLNTSRIEFPAGISNDGCTLYFASNRDTTSIHDFRLYEATRGTNVPSTVTTTIKIVGTGSIITPPYQCSTTCEFEAPPDAVFFVDASDQAIWSGSCSPYGGGQSSDGAFVFSNGGTCTVTFADGITGDAGSGCLTATWCDTGLECNLNVCRCPPDDPNCICTPTCPSNACGAPDGCGSWCPCAPGEPCWDDSDCAAGSKCCGEICGGEGCECTAGNQCAEGLECEGGLCECAPSCEGKACGESDGCLGTCRCDEGEPCATDEDCATGLVCTRGAGPRHGKPRGTNVCTPPICATDPHEQCGFPGAPCGSCDNGVPCDVDGDCPGGEVCAIGRGITLGLSFDDVCLPPACVTDPVGAGCGTEESLCGSCPCERSCDEKQCGDDPSDGCGGRCVGFCDNRASGCEVDGDCPVGNACILGGGPRIGLPQGTNVCLAAACLDPNPQRLPCGSTEAECGLCPEAPADVCQGLECGEDPTYGVACGSTCPTGQSCVLNRCVASFTAANLVLPSVSPTTREEQFVPALGTRAAQTTVPGAVDGRFGVSPHGSATYTVPIVVPPGRAGLQPSLSLDYVSGSPNGMLGVGWSLGGLSSIARCARIAARNGGWAQPVTYTDSDDLCLDGHPLALVAGTHFAPGAEYRTEVDTFNRITLVPGGFFRVEKRDGRIFTYGENARSRVYQRATPPNVARAWALSRIEDRVGNYIEFSYGSFTAEVDILGFDLRETAEMWPVEVAYGGASGYSALAHNRRVRFHYADTRFDYLEGSTSSGARVTRTKLLNRVDTLIGDELVRSYEITHEETPVGVPPPDEGVGLSRVREITECSYKTGTRVCKRPTSFTYTDRRGLLGTARVVEPQYSSFRPMERPGSLIAYSRPLVVLDTNGDGRDDVLGRTLLLATGTGSTGSEPFTQVQAGLEMFVAPTQGDVFDFDQDGRDDLLLSDSYPAESGNRLWVARSTGNTAEPFQLLPVSNALIPGGDGEIGIRSFLADLDGDGIKDLFECFGIQGPTGVSHAHYQRGLPRGGFSPERWGEVPMWGTCTLWWATPEPIFVVDLNGDGTDEILAWSQYSDVLRWARYSARPDGSAEWIVENRLPRELRDAGGRGAVRFLDVNGDGLKDIYAVLRNNEAMLFMNRGTHFDSARPAYGPGLTGDPNARYSTEYLAFIQSITRASNYSTKHSLVIDYNGDGREDLIRMFDRRGSEPATSRAAWQFDRATMAAADLSIAGLPLLVPDGTASDPVSLTGNRFTPLPNVTPAAPLPVSEWGDVNGDGSLDLLQVAVDGRLAVTYGEFGQENLMSAVTDGLGKRIDIAYADEQVFTEGVMRTYTKAVGDCLDEDREQGFSLCARQDGPLVSRYSISEVIDELGEVRPDRIFTLRYIGGRIGLLGRGFLGFDRRIVEETTAVGELVERTDIREDNRTFVAGLYPYAGLEQSRVVVTAFAQSAIERAPTRRRTVTTKDWVTRLSSAGILFPYLDESTVRTYDDFDDTGEIRRELPTLIVDNEVDAYGNVTLEVVTTEWEDQVASASTVESVFDIREGSWLVGLPERRTVRSMVVNDGQSRSETRTMDYVFDDFGLLRSTTREPEASAGDSLKLVTTYERDPSLVYAVKSVTSEGSWVEDGEVVTGARKTSVEYDADRIFPEHVHQHHGVDTCGPDQAHTVECQTHDVRYDPRDGLLVTRIDPTGVAERFAYDSFGRLEVHETPADVVQITYEDGTAAPDLAVPVFPKLMINRVSERTGAASSKRLDGLGRVVQSVILGIGGREVFEETEYRFGTLVLGKARPHVAGDSSQGIVRYQYDERFRPFRTVLADTTTIEFLYATVNTVAAEFAPRLGEVFIGGVLDGRNNTTFQYRSARGALTRTTDEKSADTLYLYGPFDVLLETEDDAGGVTEIVSDRLGRTRHVRSDNSEDEYDYTSFDEVSEHRNLVGTTRVYYDDLGRLETSDASDGITSFAYDGPQPNAIGRLVSSSGATGDVEEFEYEAPPASGNPLDNRAFLKSVHRLIGGLAFTTSMTYDSGGRLASVTYPPSADGTPAEEEEFAVHYKYGAGGYLVCLGTEVFQGAGCGDNYLWRLAADYQGQFVKEERFGNGTHTIYGYQDLTGRLSSITTARGGTNLQDIGGMFYDPNGNLRFRTQTFRDVDNGGSTTIGEEFTYDPTNQLKEVIGNGATRTFAYDNTGNLDAKPGVGTYDYAPNAGELPAPHAVRRIWRDDEVVTSFKYDLAGNVREREGEGVVGGIQTLSHTSFNLPKEINVGQGSSSRRLLYQYDATQRRVLLRLDTNQDPSQFEEQRFYAGDGYERQSLTDSIGPLVRHIYKVHVQGRQIVQVERERRGAASSETRRYLHGDHLGSSQVLTDEDGDLVRVQRFDPFGAVDVGPLGSGTDPAARLRTGFAGHESDPETGLINMRGRIYDPRVGRFLQADPMTAPEHGSIWVNRYAYAVNNPLRWTDSTGFKIDPEYSSYTLEHIVPINENEVVTKADPVPTASFPIDPVPTADSSNAASAGGPAAPSPQVGPTSPGGPDYEAYVASVTAGQRDRQVNEPGLGESWDGNDRVAASAQTNDELRSIGMESGGEDDQSGTGPEEARLLDAMRQVRDAQPRGPDQRLACGPACLIPVVLIGLAISGDEEEEGSGSPELFMAGLGGLLPAAWVGRTAAAGLGPFSQRTIGTFILQSRSGLQGRTFVHEIKVLANTSAKEATRNDFARLAGTLTAEARAAGATAVEIRGVSVINPGILRLQGLAKDLGFTVKEVGKDAITFTKGL